MNKQEANRIIAQIAANYPDTFRNMSDDAYKVMVGVWAQAFREEPYELVTNAVMAFMTNSTVRFAPNVGMIKEQIRQLMHPDELTEGEAWAKVQAALRNSAYGSEEEFAKLPPAIQKVIGSASNLKSYAMMDETQALTVFASNFQRGYRTVRNREAAMEKTPLQIRQAFAALTRPMPEALPEVTS